MPSNSIMKKQNIFKFILPLFLAMASACADSNDASKYSNKEIPVTIFDGMLLGSLLAEPEELSKSDQLESSLSKDWYAGVYVMYKEDASTQQEVKNCQDYFKASQGNKQPVKEYERSAYIEFGLMCLAARDIVNARPAGKTFVVSFELNQNTPKIMPKQLAMLLSEAQYKAMLEDKNKVYWGDVNQILGLDKIAHNKVVYNLASAQQEISIVAKGDFDKDGIEDLLITARDTVLDGSYNSLRMFLMTKITSKADFVVLKEYKAI